MGLKRIEQVVLEGQQVNIKEMRSCWTDGEGTYNSDREEYRGWVQLFSQEC